MKSSTLLFVFVLVVIALSIFAIVRMQNYEPMMDVPIDGTENITQVDPLNMTYNVDGQVFTLVDGKAEVSIPESTTKNSLYLFGQPVSADFDTDGDTDQALWLMNDAGGTGKFYYAVLVMNDGLGGKPTNAMFLGDRIAPQSVAIEEGRAVYNFAERKPGEPMTTEPSVGKSVWVHYDKNTGGIGEWVKDFEGEADSNTMTLGMKTWEWQYVLYSDDTRTTPKDPKKFTLKFNPDGTFSASTDCNGVGGEYTLGADKKLEFKNMLGTLMFCEGAQEEDFKKILTNTGSYMFTSKGELVLLIKYDSGSAIFK